MINMIKLDFTPKCVCWVSKNAGDGDGRTMVAVSDQDSSLIQIFDAKMDSSDVVFSSNSIHQAPVAVMAYNPKYDAVVSIDVDGKAEYWQPSAEFSHPKSVGWEMKLDTDLYDFVKSGAGRNGSSATSNSAKPHPDCITFDPSYEHFATFGLYDRQVRLFKFSTGKMLRKYDESISMATKQRFQKTAKGKNVLPKMDDMEFGRRLAQEKELEMRETPQCSTINVAFDVSGKFLLVPSLFGVKVLNVRTNQLCALIGGNETTRFLNVALFQGSVTKKTSISLVCGFRLLFLACYAKSVQKTFPSRICIFCRHFALR